MKLLLCKSCGNIFNLDYEEKKCRCGKTRGKYLDNLNAVYSGEYAVPLGFANDSLVEAIKWQPSDGQGYYFKAFVIPKQCDTFVKEEERLKDKK